MRSGVSLRGGLTTVGKANGFAAVIAGMCEAFGQAAAGVHYLPPSGRPRRPKWTCMHIEVALGGLRPKPACDRPRTSFRFHPRLRSDLAGQFD
jgi:hypothetical protein